MQKYRFITLWANLTHLPWHESGIKEWWLWCKYNRKLFLYTDMWGNLKGD